MLSKHMQKKVDKKEFFLKEGMYLQIVKDIQYPLRLKY